MSTRLDHEVPKAGLGVRGISPPTGIGAEIVMLFFSGPGVRRPRNEWRKAEAPCRAVSAVELEVDWAIEGACTEKTVPVGELTTGEDSKEDVETIDKRFPDGGSSCCRRRKAS